MNILNVQDIERELARYGARAIHAHAERWVITVARNHILGKLADKDVYSNFREYNPAAKLELLMPHPARLPDWANRALENGEKLHWFDPVQTQRRVLWQTLELIVMWYNTFKPEDTRLPRCDRINFDTAAKAAAMWFKDVNENVWSYVKDKPPVVRIYDHGYFWVRLVTALHFEREGKLMKHCVGNGGYFETWRKGQREYYSLRDKHNKPHCTVEVAVNDGRVSGVTQCKGGGNLRPPRAYQPYMRRFFNDMHWAIHGDASNID